MKLKTENPYAVVYFDAVRRRLLDVPWAQRQELLASLGERLSEMPASADPVRILGTADDYARLIREAAGLAPTRSRPFPYVRALRTRTKVLAVVAFAVVALGIATTVEWLHYQPLKVETYMGYSSAASITPNVPSNDKVYRYERGATFVTGMLLHNTGLADVTISAPTAAPGNPLRLRELRATTNINIGGLYDQAPVVRRVVLRPGRSVTLFVVWTMTPFELGKQSSIGMQQPPLPMEVLGVHHLVDTHAPQLTVVNP